MTRLLFGLFLALLLAACAQSPSRPQAWSPPDECHATLEQAMARELPQPRLRQVQMGFRSLASCMETAHGAEPIVLFDLQRLSFPAEIDVSVYAEREHVLAARVDVLGANYESLQQHPFNSFVHRGDRFTRRVFLNADYDQARYLLLRLDAEAYGEEMQHIYGQRQSALWMAGGYMGTISNGTEKSNELKFLDLGKFSIQVVKGWSDPRG